MRTMQAKTTTEDGSMKTCDVLRVNLPPPDENIDVDLVSLVGTVDEKAIGAALSGSMSESKETKVVPQSNAVWTPAADRELVMQRVLGLREVDILTECVTDSLPERFVQA